MRDSPRVLLPFNADEALTVSQACVFAKRSAPTMRLWAEDYDIGRRVAGKWMISIVALAMHLDGDRPALALYLSGDRESSSVLDYFARFRIAVYPTVRRGALQEKTATKRKKENPEKPLMAAHG